MFNNIVDGTCTVLTGNKNEDIYVELLNSMVTLFWLQCMQ